MPEILRKRKTAHEVPYYKKWEKYIHLYGSKDRIPHNVRERVKKYFKGKTTEDPLA